MATVNPEDVTARKIEPSGEDVAKSHLLELLSEGHHYVFLTLHGGEDDNGEYAEIHAMTSINDGQVLEFVLETALAQLGTVVGSSVSAG